jgi:ABC-type phosphate transport system substrate-binding protein
MKTIIMRFLTLSIAVLLAQALVGQSYKVIVNTSNSTSSISKKDISDLFMKKKIKWDNGTAVMPVDLGASSKVRETFSQEIHGKSVGAIRSAWQQAAFSGTGSAPPEKTGDAEVIDYVKKNPGAIGYVTTSTKTEDVKVIDIK